NDQMFLCTFTSISTITTLISYFFFFQAEDGIRDGHVTGVQTCALPIFSTMIAQLYLHHNIVPDIMCAKLLHAAIVANTRDFQTRSEERRVGKSVDLGGWRDIKKKKIKKKERI